MIRRLGSLVLIVLAACGPGDPSYRSVEELMDPETCQECHPKHYDEWAGSMHAYAADDPVFLAMNARGQLDTAGALGDFCINCHAPMAKRLGLSTDGLNLADVPQSAKGITCYFCHNVTEVRDDHNNPLILAGDQTMRAAVKNPVDSPAHASAFEPLLDGNSTTSTPMCGSCHDIVTQGGVALERTFTEWEASVFAKTDEGAAPLSCAGCHMHAQTDVIADGPGLDVKQRQDGRHEHFMIGVDTAHTPWPGTADQRAQVQFDLDTVLAARLCVLPDEGGRITLRLDNVGAGHMFPSGASHDRRAWAEIIAYDAADEVVFQTGVVAVDQDPEDVVATDPTIWGLYDRTVTTTGDPAKFFWDVDHVALPNELLPPSVTNDQTDERFDHSVTRSFPVGVLLPQIARVTARVRIRALPLNLIHALAQQGLDQSIADTLPTIDLAGTQRTWTMADAGIDRCVN